MDNIKTKKSNLQKKFEELKLTTKEAGVKHFMELYDEINSYNREKNTPYFICLDNDTNSVNH